MIRRLVALVATVALSGLACTSSQSSTAAGHFRQPSSVAVFRGVTLQYPTKTWPYIVVANPSRNDLTIVDGANDRPVAAPIALRALVLPVADRPTLVSAASLGDYDDPADPTTAKPDLLVAVSSGDSVLQLVETWNTANVVHPEAPLGVDLEHAVLALAPVPSAAGTARIAAVLADHRVAVVTYARGAGGAIAPVGSPAFSAPLPFQPVAIAAMPGAAAADPATALYVATRDPIAADASGHPVYGVEEISLPDLSPVRALGARAPTRLVAAARLQEWNGSSAASDASAFAAPVWPRVYAVLDESGCGPTKPIDCGVVTLDAGPGVVSGTVAIPRDDPFMPYRAPMRIPGRPLAIAASSPPRLPPPAVAGEPDFQNEPTLAGYMRLYSAGVARATTAAAAVPSDDGAVYFLDLGRFETATASLPLVMSPASTPVYTQPVLATDGTACTAQKPGCGERRLWLEQGGAFIAGPANVPGAVTITPGWTPEETWVLVYQGVLSNDLLARTGAAGEYDPVTHQPWLALQVDSGGGAFTDVVHLWDPALGVAPGDILVIRAYALGCTGTGSSDSTIAQFEVEVDALLPPADAYPGGAVTLRHVTTREDPAWATCYAALSSKVATGTVRNLTVTARAGGYVLTGSSNPTAGAVRVETGYVVGDVATDPPSIGRPQPGVPFTLRYEDEDALASACPFEKWSWNLPVPPDVLACDAACRSGCEKLASVRKLRRYQGISVACATTPAETASCETQWGTSATFPAVASPVALGFTFDVQPRDAAGDVAPFRDLRLTLSTRGGAYLLQAIGTSTSPYQASGITTFDRSPWVTDTPAGSSTPTSTEGYRFLVSYPADFVLDTTPGQAKAPSTVIR